MRSNWNGESPAEGVSVPATFPTVSHLQRFAGVFRSRHLRWQLAHDALTVSLIAIIFS